MRSTIVVTSVVILLFEAVSGQNLDSAEEGRCLAWMMRRVAGVDMPNPLMPTTTSPSRQGKRGRDGMKGEPGIQGPPGTCQCDRDELAALREKYEVLEGDIAQIKNRMEVIEARFQTTQAETTTQGVTTSSVELQCDDYVHGNEHLFPETVTAVKCPAGCQTSSERIWGTGIYSHGSAICKAAIHNGILSSAGGVTFVKKLPRQRGYRSSTAHGITTSNYGGRVPAYKFCNGMDC